jgi:hypothetical protein
VISNGNARGGNGLNTATEVYFAGFGVRPPVWPGHEDKRPNKLDGEVSRRKTKVDGNLAIRWKKVEVRDSPFTSNTKSAWHF